MSNTKLGINEIALDRTELKINEVELDMTELGILVALGDRIMHGYQIMKVVQEGQSIPIGAASFYRKLHKLAELGLTKEVPAPPEESDPRKRYYSMTVLGQNTARTELNRLSQFIQTAQAKSIFGILFGEAR